MVMNIHGEYVCSYNNRGKKVSYRHPKCIHNRPVTLKEK